MTIDEEFNEKFDHTNVNECGYDDDGEPDNQIICSKDGMVRYKLSDMKKFVKDNYIEKSEVKKAIIEELHKWNGNGKFKT